MARPPGMPKTGGRKKGSRNNNAGNKIRIAAASQNQITPLEYMLKIMRCEEVEGIDFNVLDGKEVIELRFEAAKAAAPYCHPKFTAIAMKVEEVDVKPKPRILDYESARRIIFALEREQRESITIDN